MATKPRPTAAEIAEQLMPGWKAVAPSGPIKAFGARAAGAPDGETTAYSSPKVDAVMPSTRDLRRKFLGDEAADAADEPAEPIDADVEPVDMKSGDLERTVGINRRTGKIEWSQG